MSDLIKRTDAIKAVSKVDDYGDGIGFEVRSHCLVELELVPSADRPQGNLIKIIEAQKQLMEEYERKIAVLEERNGLLEKMMRDLVRIAKGADDE